MNSFSDSVVMPEVEMPEVDLLDVGGIELPDPETVVAVQVDEMRRGDQEMLRHVALADGGVEESMAAVRKHMRWHVFFDERSLARPETRAQVLGERLCAAVGGNPVEVNRLLNELYGAEEVPAHFKTRDEGHAHVWRRFAAYQQKEQEARMQRVAAVQESLKRMDAYVSGDEVAAGADGEKETLTAQDVANVRTVLEPDVLESAEAVREFMRVYVRPLDEKEDAEEVLRTLDGLEDELFACIGADAKRAELACGALMHWADGFCQSGKVGVGDEFVVAVGKKLSNWANPRTRALFATQGAVGAAGAMNTGALQRAGSEIQSAVREAKERQAARSILRAAINKGLELGDNVGWWEGAARTAAQMAGDSLPYLLPGVGLMAGSADSVVTGLTETADQFALSGMTDGEATGQAVIQSGVQTVVELLPFGKVGGKGLSAVTRKFFGKSLEDGHAGRFARWVVRNTQRSTARALVAEGAASFVDEGILEPIAGGLMTYGAEQTFDVLGVPHGKSKEFAACFDELKALFTDPYQAAGLLLFTAGLTGASAYEVHQNVKFFARHRRMWEAAGLTPEQVDRVMAAKDRVATGANLVQEGWTTDPAGMRERVLKACGEIAERGEVLVLTGEGALAPELENSELAEAYRAVWQKYQDDGLLPRVEAVGDNQYRITQDGVDVTLDAKGADAYLQHAIDEVDRVMTRELQQRVGKGESIDLRAEIARGVSEIAGAAAMRAAGERGAAHGVSVEDLTRGLPEWIAEGIAKRGEVTLQDAENITEWAVGTIDGLVAEGMSEQDARMSRAVADGAARSLGEWATFARDFAHREELAGLEAGQGAVKIARSRNRNLVEFDGHQVLGQSIMLVPGRVTHFGAVEDVTESVFDMVVQQRAKVILENQADVRDQGGESRRDATPSERAEAEAQAWRELGEVVNRARAAILKADSGVQIEEVQGDDRMGIIEALSTMAQSRFLSSGVVPGWMQGLTRALKGNLAAADAVEKVRAAYAEVLRSDPGQLSELEGVLDRLGVHVQDVFQEARIEAVDIQAWRSACALVSARADGPTGSGGSPVSEVVRAAADNEDAITRHETAAPIAPDKDAARDAEDAREVLEGMVPGSNAPAEIRGVFVGDKCYYNAAGGFWCGMIDKMLLKDGTEQVKVGAKGKHGVIAGRELTGRFQQNVGAIYVWRRSNGELQVISGRHRFAKLMEDDGAQYCNAYVFAEDAEHDERWARMLDYENNMRDDQADEVTAATYVRETGLSDAELEVRGLMRNGTRCKRGALVGRHAREELWTRFINGAVKPIDAEIICNLTRSIRDQERVEEIQRRCCMLLDEGKGWDYIGAMVQLMANKESVMPKQGLLDFGADFEADLARAAEWIERNLAKVRESITLLKQGRKLSGKKRKDAERLGINTATAEDSEQMLYDLELLRGQFEMIGSYPDLVAQAQMWDGQTEVDPVGQYLERARVEREQARAEGEMDAEEYLESRLDDATGEFSFSIFNERRWANDVWPTRAMKKIEADWLERLDAYIAEYQAAKANPNMKRPMGQEIYVCPTPGVLSLVGVTSRDVVTTRHALDHDMFTKHGMTRKALRHLPSAIANPICISESQSVPGALEILTTLTETVEDSKTKALVKKNVLVALHVGLKSTESPALIVSKIASAYGKNRIKTILDTHKILYWNDQKGKVMLNNYRLQLPQAIQHDLSTGNIWDFNDLVKYKQQNKFSFSMERNLAAVHSLSPEKFLAALELGGMPMPSVAVTRLDRPYGWGGVGNIMLVGRPAMVDPKKGTEVYSADAWTGKFPRVIHKHQENADFKEAAKAAGEMEDKYGYVFYQLADKLRQADTRSDLQYLLETDNGKALFAYMHGYEPKARTMARQMDYQFLDKQFAKDTRNMWENGEAIKEGQELAFADAVEASLNRWLEGQDEKYRKLYGRLYGDLLSDLRSGRPYGVWFRLKMSLNNLGKRELDANGNREMLAKYADKHKKAFAAWVNEKVDKWRSKEGYVRETGKVATLDNVLNFMLSKKGLNNEDFMGFSPGKLRAALSDKMRSLDDIKGRRERLSDSDTSKESKKQSEELMMEYTRMVRGHLAEAGADSFYAIDYGLESLSLVKGKPTVEKVQRAVRKVFSYTKAAEAMAKDNELLQAGVDAVTSVRAEIEDYMEAVPQRAVQMNEWEYAVMPESLKKNKAVMAGLRENGIRPRFHDGTEDGRKAALSGLVNDARVSFGMEKASLRALDLLSGRADERSGEMLIKDWRVACENWGRMGREGSGRLGNGAKMLGEIQALIGATKGVLPEKYCRMGNLNALMRWAAVYARMQQEGELPQAGEIKGPIYAKFLERLQGKDELNRLQGMSEDEAREAMAMLAGERLDVAVMKVARECRMRLELFLKDRERERIEWIVERAYPKRQSGQKWPRGKMGADAYRRMQRAYELMDMGANEVADLIADAKRRLDELEPSDAEYAKKEEELEEEISLAQTFGAWEDMGFEQARRACGVMAEMVMLGRASWKERLMEERRRANFDRVRISRNFRTKLEDMQRKRAKSDAKEKGRKLTIAKKIAMGSMSYGQLMLALEPQLGKEFTGRHMRMIAQAHERLQLGTQERHRWMYSTLGEITGLKSEGEMEEWLNANNQVFDTGIVLRPYWTEQCRLSYEEVEGWLSLTKEERDKRRKQMQDEANAQGEESDRIPSEEMLERMREKLEASKKAKTHPKEYVVSVQHRYESPLHCTKEALLYAILTFEQDDYKRLMDVNGVSEGALQRMRELVGDKMLAWGYAMREKLSEHGKTMAEVYEAYTGVPFAQRANYFRGVFDIAKSKDKGEAVDTATSITGGKYGCLIPRQYHHQMLNWGTSATAVFIGTLKEQQNYVCTSHITREWRTLLSNQGFEKRLRAEIGDAALDLIHGWCKMIDGAVLADAKVNALMNRFLGRVMGAYAVSRLAGNVYTIVKQVSGLLNGFVGGYVPERVLADDGVAQQLVYRHIGFGEYVGALAKAASGQTEITAEEIAGAGFIAGRQRVEGSHLEDTAMLAPGQGVPGKTGRVARAVHEGSMDVIGWADRKANTLAALALAEVVYQQAKRENKDGLVPDADLRRVAIETAGMMIDRAAQPQLRTQKGYWAAGGGAFGAMGNFFYMFKSEVLGKLGLYVAQMFAGHHGAWLGGALSFGVLNSLILALIDYVRGYWYDDEEDKWTKRAKSFAFNVVANDISSVPIAGDMVGDLRTMVLDEWSFRSSRVVDMVNPFSDLNKYSKREWKNIQKGASWDKHVTALCGLARSLGAAGGWWQGSGNAAVGSCAELALAAASISNLVRFGKDGTVFALDEDDEE